MPTFQDNASRTWSVNFTVDDVKRMRQDMDFDLLEIFAGGQTTESLIMRLRGDPVLLVDLLYVVCQEQANNNNVSDEDFGRAMAGDAILHATNAFLEAAVNFSPSPRDRARMTAAMEVVNRWEEKANDVLDQSLNTLEAALELRLKRLTPSFGDALGSSGSTPGPTASEN